MTTNRYWVLGGQYEDCNFARLTPGTVTVAGPFNCQLRARTEWQRLTFRDRIGATTRYTIATEPMVAAER